MATTSFTSTTVGSKLAAATGSKITGLTINQPTAAAEENVPLILIDQAVAPANAAAMATPPRTLWAGILAAFATMYAVKPTAPTLSPGLTAPVWPMALGTNMNIPFANGVWVQSCPANVTFTLTTA
jgi:hypothetical protein